MGSKINNSTRIVGGSYHYHFFFCFPFKNFLSLYFFFVRYIISNLVLSPLNSLVRSINFCSIEFLRATNTLFSIGLYVVIWKILTYLHPYQNKRTRAFNTFVLSLFPVNWFYNFLYYTDSGSTFFVLCAYLLTLRRRFWMSAMVCSYVLFNIYIIILESNQIKTSFIKVSGVSVVFRQTNIGWVCFMFGISVIDVLSDNNKFNHFHGILRPVKGKDIPFGKDQFIISIKGILVYNRL